MGKQLVKGYFKKNLGDDIFLKILLERYQNEDFYVYSSYDYKNVYKTNNLKIHSNKNWLNIIRVLINKFFKLFRSEKVIVIEDIKKYDNIILLGGSVFMEYPNMNFKQYTNTQFKKGQNNYILGANFGPYQTNDYLNIHKEEIFPKIKDICFRDSYSYKLFKELANTRYASDIVFSLDVSKVKKEDTNKVVISVINVMKDNMNFSQNDYNKKIIEIINYLKQLNMKIVLMSFSESQGDEIIINQIISNLKNKENVEKYFYRGNIEEALEVLGTSKIIFGTRFHANILGMVLGKTVIPIAYSDKTINVLKDMNFKGKVFDIRDMINFDVNSLTDEDLNYKLDVSFQKKDAERHFEKLDKVLERKQDD